MFLRKPPPVVTIFICIAFSVIVLTVFIKSSLNPLIGKSSFGFKPFIEGASRTNPQSSIINNYELETYRRDTDQILDKLNERLRVQRALLEELACGQTGIGARGGFCLKTDNIDVGGNNAWDVRLSKNLDVLFAGQTVGDFGAGLGWYGRWFLRDLQPRFSYGKALEQRQLLNRTDVVAYLMKSPQAVRSWHGFDGAGNVELVTGRFVRFLDLTEEQDLPMKFDWVMSLEVGEHIPNAYEEIFVDNLVRHACKGIFLSWAVIGQGGHHHVNNHNNDYIKKLLATKGFVSLEHWQTKVRSEIELGWFGGTLMAFERAVPLNHPKCKPTSSPATTQPSFGDATEDNKDV